MKRKLAGALLLLGIALLLLLYACLGIAFAVGRPRPAILANENLPPNDQPSVRIAVLGDTQKGVAAFAELLQRAKGEGMDLAVHTGDFVSHADQGHYNLALAWLDRAELGVPVLITPGNHDLKGAEDLFPSRIGPLQGRYRWGPVDLVIVNNALGLPDLPKVEELLKDAPGPILLFMHVPPFDAMKETFEVRPGYQPFLDLVGRHPIRYVFSGHAHTYRRIEHAGTVYIANGVGGDSDSWQFDQRAYVTVVDATADLVRDRGISIAPVFSLWANVEHLAVAHVAEFIFRTLPGFPVFLLFHVALVVALVRFRKKPEMHAQIIGIQ
jgi:3',5'-cyclic AMP phosphodiesterase CpdA